MENGKVAVKPRRPNRWNVDTICSFRPPLPSLFIGRAYYRPRNQSFCRPTADTRALRLEFESPVSAHARGFQRNSPVSAHARGFQRNSPLSAHRSIDASFSPSVNVVCLFQVARNFNWSGERDWSIGESAYVTTPSRFYLTRLESRIWNFDSSCNFRINFSFFLPQRGYEKINAKLFSRTQRGSRKWKFFWWLNLLDSNCVARKEFSGYSLKRVLLIR